MSDEKPNLIRIILADDHQILRSGIRRLIKETGTMEVVAEASNGEELMNVIGHYTYDLLILDLNMPHIDGLEVLKKIRSLYPDLKILILSMHSEPEFFRRALADRVQGYLLKDEAFENLVNAIKTICSGRRVFSKGLSAASGISASVIHDSAISLSLLTEREREVLHLLARGFTNKIIGEELDISPRTVESYRGRIMEKLQFDNFSDLLRYAIEKGLG